MGNSLDNDDESRGEWSEYRRLVMHELRYVRDAITSLGHQVSDGKEELSGQMIQMKQEVMATVSETQRETGELAVRVKELEDRREIKGKAYAVIGAIVIALISLLGNVYTALTKH